MRATKKKPKIHTTVSAVTPMPRPQWISFHSRIGGKVRSTIVASIAKPIRITMSAPRPASMYSSPSCSHGCPAHQPAIPRCDRPSVNTFQATTAASAQNSVFTSHGEASSRFDSSGPTNRIVPMKPQRIHRMPRFVCSLRATLKFSVPASSDGSTRCAAMISPKATCTTNSASISAKKR